MIDWELVKIALETKQVNESAAGLLLKQAMGCEPTCCDTPAESKPVAPEKAVIYGKDGYTYISDPRTPACQKHEFDNSGKPIAVHTAVLVQPDTAYKCVLVDLLPHDESCQVYVEVYDANGNAASKTNTRLLTGWSESAKYDALYDAPASPGSFSMGREAKFWPPNLGSCGAVVVDGSGRIDSDVVGSLGISRGTHMSFRVVFRARK